MRELRIGQFGGYYGDRASGMAELIADGVDVLTADYLAELTMLILHKTRSRGGAGYATTFVGQMEEHAAAIEAAGIKVVVNAGGLDPLGCAEAVRDALRRAGTDLIVAAVQGDDVAALVGTGGVALVGLEPGVDAGFDRTDLLTANAYLGAWPIVEALNQGADVVVTGRTTDASLVVAPAAWHFGWARDDWDCLAGAVWAGHVIECGAQATGGNYAFFAEQGDLGMPGMPIAAVREDGSATITKTRGSGGVVSVDTVTAQLLYEVGSRWYANPDVDSDLASVSVEQTADDEVTLRGARGRPSSGSTKVSVCTVGGYRNTVTIGLTGADIDEKVAWLRRQFAQHVFGEAEPEEVRWSVVGPADPSGGSLDEATAWVVITARDRDRHRVSRRAFANKATELGVSSVPGLYFAGAPRREQSYGVQLPCLLDKELVHATVTVLPGTTRTEVSWGPYRSGDLPVEAAWDVPLASEQEVEAGDTLRIPFGRIIGARSGDKAGIANIGVWARGDDEFDWLAATLNPKYLCALLPELDGFKIERFVLPNLRALNFVVHGYLGQGVASCTRLDAQAKGLGEYLRSRLVDVPTAFARR